MSAGDGEAGGSRWPVRRFLRDRLAAARGSLAVTLRHLAAVDRNASLLFQALSLPPTCDNILLYPGWSINATFLP